MEDFSTEMSVAENNNSKDILPEDHDGISDKERGLIEEIRSRMGDDLSQFYGTDFNLKRWLVGWNYDLEKIMPRLRKHTQYRRCLKLDAPEDQFTIDPIMAEYYPQCYFDHTSKKRGKNELIQILCLGKIDVYGVMHSVNPVEYLSSRIYYTEKCLRKIMHLEKITGRQAGMIHILDAAGSVFDQWYLKAATGPFKDLNYLLQENYVEITNKVIVINAGNFIYTLWKLIQPFLAQRSKEKVVILGSNWRQEILNFVDSESLPPDWGGTLKNWEEKLIVPRHIPIDLYYKPTEVDNALMTSGQLQARSVPRNSFTYDVIEMTDDDVTEGRKIRIKWYVKADYSSVRFGMFYTKTKPNIDTTSTANLNIDTDSMEMLLPKYVCYCSAAPIAGEMICEKSGYYVFEIGSTSFVFSQTIYCNISQDYC